METAVREKIGEWVYESTSQPFEVVDFDPCGGGCIHETGICSDGHRNFFVKFNRASFGEQFAAEASALDVIARTHTLRVPQVIARGVVGGHGCLVLEALELAGRGSRKAWQQLGMGLAAMHRVEAETYGWFRNNFIGATPQSNRRHVSWAEFFVQERLEPQFMLASRNGHAFIRVNALLARVERMLAGHYPPASLLHGDLWSGNVGFTTDDEPVVFDPASYYGDRETDIAFSHLFGGFPPAFYEAYEDAYPLDDGHRQRVDVYNLYHVLNHANLFGPGYVDQAQSMIHRICG